MIDRRAKREGIVSVRGLYAIRSRGSGRAGIGQKVKPDRSREPTAQPGISRANDATESQSDRVPIIKDGLLIKPPFSSDGSGIRANFQRSGLHITPELFQE